MGVAVRDYSPRRTRRTPRTQSCRLYRRCRAVVTALVLVCASVAGAADRYAVVITGASGGSAYAEKYTTWRTSLVTLLKQKLNYPDDRLFVLAESESQNVLKATRENVRALFESLSTRLAGDDLLFVFLIGHGTADNDEAKFNLVGPDLTSSEWSRAAESDAGPARVHRHHWRKLSVHAAAGGAGPRRRHRDRYARPAVRDDLPGIHRQGVRRSVSRPRQERPRVDWEAFSYASAGVRQWFERKASWPPSVRCSTTTATALAARPRTRDRTVRWPRSIYLAPETPDAAEPRAGDTARRARTAARRPQAAAKRRLATRCSTTSRSKRCLSRSPACRAQLGVKPAP